MRRPYQEFLACEADTESVAARLAPLLAEGALVFLVGELGAGKTTFCRGILRALGHMGAVKSPTFTLVEPYQIGDLEIFHFDLYRLSDPGELEYIGVDDYLNDDRLCLVEWPERGADLFPDCDLIIELTVSGLGRALSMNANSRRGERVIRQLQAGAG